MKFDIQEFSILPKMKIPQKKDSNERENWYRKSIDTPNPKFMLRFTSTKKRPQCNPINLINNSQFALFVSCLSFQHEIENQAAANYDEFWHLSLFEQSCVKLLTAFFRKMTHITLKMFWNRVQEFSQKNFSFVHITI